MKIKITTAGYTRFNGEVGDVQFTDGVSVLPVSPSQAAFVAAIHTIEQVEGETQEQASDERKDLTPEGQEDNEKPEEQADLPSEEQNAETPEQEAQEQAETKE